MPVVDVQQQLSQLNAQLQQDVDAQVPPFGAESLDLARQLGKTAAPLLLQHLESGGTASLLALEALRQADPGSYASLPLQERARIYVDALAQSHFFNGWGLPGYQLTPTARALIALGEGAVPFLRPHLGDRRPAPLEGSQDATTSEMYGNRVRDYAWVLINEIQGRPYTYSQDPVERDRAIEALQRGLAGNEGRT
jgi:hypothetical protein